MEIENKVIVVTGGSGGIGQALATSFIHEKAKVVIILDINFDNFELGGKKLISKVCDVTDEKELTIMQLYFSFFSLEKTQNIPVG